jgi:hypothetical protein
MSLNKTFTVLLDGVEQMEIQRLLDVKRVMEEFWEGVKEMRIGVFDSEQKLIDSTEAFKPYLDIQRFIERNSKLDPPPQLVQQEVKYWLLIFRSLLMKFLGQPCFLLKLQ